MNNSSPTIHVWCDDSVRVRHNPVLIRTSTIDPDTQRPFNRITCKDCGHWLGDEALPPVELERVL